MSSTDQNDSVAANRYYTSESYLLPSDDVERDRLERQHYVVVAHTPMMLPSQLALKPGDALLDAGTGTGIWATTVARLCPASVTVIGIDIESQLFPSEPPPNTKFLVQSSLDLPTEWNSTFVLVHQRLMICAFSLEAWKSCISSFFRVLKPGGWVRLEEFDCYRAFDGYKDPLPLNRQYISALRTLAESRGIRCDTLPKLTKLLEEAGFRNVQVTHSNILQAGGETTIGAWKAMKALYLRLGGLGMGATSEEFDAFMDRMSEEQRGSFDEYAVVTWTAQKPE